MNVDTSRKQNSLPRRIDLVSDQYYFFFIQKEDEKHFKMEEFKFKNRINQSKPKKSKREKER